MSAKRSLDLSLSRPVNESAEVSSNDIVKRLLALPIGKSLKSDVGDVERVAEDDFRIRVSPEHFRKALDNILA